MKQGMHSNGYGFVHLITLNKFFNERYLRHTFTQEKKTFLHEDVAPADSAVAVHRYLNET